MVIACRWVTIWRARHNHKFYGETERYFLLDQSRARIFSVVYGNGYGRPVETLQRPDKYDAQIEAKQGMI
jgi:hypothetical protein